jgi:cytochrome P450
MTTLTSHVRADYNPFDPAQKRDPFPLYAHARRETPVFFSPILNMWIVTRHEDILTVLKDPAVFSSMNIIEPPMPPPPEVLEILMQGIPFVPALINNDPPSHTRIRTLCNKAFSPQRVAAMEGRIRELAGSFIDGFAHEGRADLITRFARPLPQIIIADIVGVPRAETAKFVRLADAWAAVIFDGLPADVQLRLAPDSVAFQAYNAEMIAQRRAQPQDDLMSDLVHAQMEGEAQLTDWEIVSIVSTLLIAGHNTITHLIGNALLVLNQHPEYLEALRKDPALAPAIVEEVLRIESPAPGLPRLCTQDYDLNGVTIPKGAKLFLAYTSANRDESVFPKPEQFDIKRPNINKHLAFGRGIHFCIGAPLARLEGRIALEMLAQRLPNLRVVPGQELEFSRNITFRGPESLFMEWDVAA